MGVYESMPPYLFSGCVNIAFYYCYVLVWVVVLKPDNSCVILLKTQ